MAGEQRVLELRQDGVLVALHHREERLAGLDARDGVAPQLLLHRHRGPPRLAELADRGGRGVRGQSSVMGEPTYRRRRAPLCLRPDRASEVTATDRRPVPSRLHGGARRGPGARRSPTTTSAAPGTRTPSTTPAGRPSRCRATGARPRPSPTPTARSSTAARSTRMGPAEGRRAWLTFDGLFYQGDVWLDGAYLGDTEGYFAPHTFEVTDALRARGEHHLAVEVTCSRPTDLTAKRNITGVFQHWDCLDPDWNPGGIWRPVRVDRDRARPHRPAPGAVPGGDARAGGARAARHARQRRRAHGVPCDTTLGGLDHVDRPAARGRRQRRRVDPHRRPTRALVAARARRRRPCTTSTCRCALDADEGGGASDERHLRTGPAPGPPALLDRQRQRRAALPQGLEPRPDADGPRRGHARGAGARRRAGLRGRARPAPDPRPHHAARALRRRRRGRACSSGRTSRCSGATPAASASRPCGRPTAAVDLLGHHPSIAIWCGHNEPMAIENDPGDVGRPEGRPAPGREGGGRAGAAHLEQDGARPLGEAGAREGRRHPAGHRPLAACSPTRRSSTAPTATSTSAGTTAHERDLPGFLRAMPADGPLRHRVRRPGGARRRRRSASPSAGPTSTGSGSAAPTRCSEAVFDRHVPPADHATFDELARPPRRRTRPWSSAGTSRRCAASSTGPTGGFAQFCFADGHPAVTWSVLGHDRAPKARLRRAARGVPAGDRRRRPAARARSTAGQALALDVHVVSDLRTPGRRRRGHRAACTWEGGSRTLALARRHPRRRVRAGRHGPDRRARRARARSRSCSTAATAASRSDNRYEATDRPADG